MTWGHGVHMTDHYCCTCRQYVDKKGGRYIVFPDGKHRSWQCEACSQKAMIRDSYEQNDATARCCDLA